MHEFRVNRVINAVDGRRRVVWQAVNEQPGWVSRAALMVFFLVILIPVALLLFLALLAAIVVFGTLAMVSRLMRLFRGPPRTLAEHRGRENVRVINRE